MTVRPMHILLPVVLLAAALAAFAMLQLTRPAPAPVLAEEREWIVNVEAVTPSTFTPTATLYGRIDSPRVAELSAAIDADVIAVEVLAGHRVPAGRLLLRLDERDTVLERQQREAEVADIRAQISSENLRHQTDVGMLVHQRELLSLAERAVSRAQDLASSRAGSDAQFDEARQAAEIRRMALASSRLDVESHPSRLAQLEARLARAEALLRKVRLDEMRSELRAPFDGRIASVDVAPGDRVRVGDTLVSMFEVASVEIRGQIPMRLLAPVRARLDAGGRLGAHARIDGVTVSAHLDRLAATVERGSGGVDGFFRVDSGGDELAIGRTVELVLELPPVADAVELPVEALYGIDRIFIVEDDRLRELRVQRLGEMRTDDGDRRILVRADALRAGTPVVTTQLPNAIEGLRVRTASAPLPRASAVGGTGGQAVPD